MPPTANDVRHFPQHPLSRTTTGCRRRWSEADADVRRRGPASRWSRATPPVDHTLPPARTTPAARQLAGSGVADVRPPGARARCGARAVGDPLSPSRIALVSSSISMSAHSPQRVGTVLVVRSFAQLRPRLRGGALHRPDAGADLLARCLPRTGRSSSAAPGPCARARSGGRSSRTSRSRFSTSSCRRSGAARPPRHPVPRETSTPRSRSMLALTRTLRVKARTRLRAAPATSAAYVFTSAVCARSSARCRSPVSMYADQRSRVPRGDDELVELGVGVVPVPGCHRCPRRWRSWRRHSHTQDHAASC